MPLFDADIAEIVRSQKKDDEYIGEFTNSIRILAQQFLGSRRYAGYQRELTLIGPLIYYAATTLSGLQTLGEEYVGLVELVRSDRIGQTVPSLVRRLVFILLQVSGPYTFDLLLSRIRKTVITGASDDGQRYWIRILDTLRRDFVPVLERFHLALFYIFGRYYHLSKRATTVAYGTVHVNAQKWDSLSIFRWLGYLSILQISFSSVLWIYSELKSFKAIGSRQRSSVAESESNINEFSKGVRCQLCLDEGKPFACTPCGHPFCWPCLLEHVTENNNCPLCRSETTPSRIIPLFNL